MDDLKAKIAILGGLGHWKIDQTRKWVIFSWTCFTFCPIAQLPDVSALKFEVLLQAVGKGFPTHPVRARKNEY